MHDKTGNLAASKDESEAIAFVRISEEHKTKRFRALMMALVVLGAITAWAVVRIFDKPWWEVLCGTIVACVAGPSGIFWFLALRFKRYTSMNQSRVAEMEKSLDPARISSNLKADGSNPPEDYP